MKVNISVHGRWHAFELANGLHRRGVMGRLVTTYPRMVARRFVDSGIEVRTKPWLELRRRLYDRFRIGHKPDLAIARAFGAFAAEAAIGDADLLVGWSAGLLEAIAPARASGMKVVVVRGSTHIRNQMCVLRDAFAEFGLDYRGTDPEIVARELAEYEGADAIDVATEYAAQTFVDEGVARSRIIVNPYGVDLVRFSPVHPPRVNDGPVRVLFVGRVGIQKGVPWLLKAFSRTGAGSELHLIGPLDPEARTFLNPRVANVFVHGPLPGDRLAKEYASADIFCLPSLQEGGVPMTLLQAMAMGLPAIVTPPSRGPVRTGVEGIVVPARSAEGITHALDRLIGSAELRRAMGDAARRAVAEKHGWQDYADRAIAAYRGLLA